MSQNNEIPKWETDIVKNWRKQFEHIMKEVVCLVRNKHTYVEVRNIIAGNDTARKPSKFHGLFTEGYIALSLLRVRRLCSGTKGDISLRNLFKDMKTHNHEVSLDRFIRLLKLTDSCHPERSEGSQRYRCHTNVSVDYAHVAFRFFASLRFAQNDIIRQVLVQQELVSKHARKSVSLSRLYIEDSDDKQFDRKEAIRIFEEICGRENKVLPKSVICKHESNLIKNTQLITDYATKFYAHNRNYEDIDKIPIFGDLDKAIDEMEAVIMKYGLLIKGSMPLSLFPEPSYNWKQIFYQAWLPKQKDIKV